MGSISSNSISTKGEMDTHIKSMEKSGLIKPCEFSRWNTACFLVKKKGGKSFRFVADMRPINAQSISDDFELPNIAHLLDRITETKYMSTFDFLSSFNQIPLTEKNQHITAFSYQNLRYSHGQALSAKS